MAIRVHTLAKELGVKSKSIVEKCQAEGLDVKNHMSVLSAGLAATICEWFSEGEHVTTEETSARVDLKKVRHKPRKRAAKKESPATQDDQAATAVAEPAAPATGKKAEAKPTKRKSPTKLVAQPGEQVEAASVTEAGPALGPPTVEESPTLEQEAPAVDVEPPPTKVVKPAKAPKVPAKVIPAGPKNVPLPAELKGPRVVRVDEVKPARPRPRRAAGEVSKPPAETMPLAAAPEREKKGRAKKGETEEERTKRDKLRAAAKRGRGGETRQYAREWRDRDLLERSERLAVAADHPGLIGRKAELRHQKTTVAVRKTKVQVTEPIVLKDYCAAIGVTFNRLFPKLADHGTIATINQVIPADLAELLALEFNVELEVVRRKSRYQQLQEQFADRSRENQQPRPPIVTFLGHVDHGKTSLLDAIRKTRVVSKEAGGITQHIGAYRYQVDDSCVVFLDTPGHEAFTALRARGAQMTDIVVLVVAGDDGVMPQTREAISHAKAAEVSVVVALNKMDLPNVDENRVLGQLAEQGLNPTEWGGDVDVIRTSAQTGMGIKELVEHLNTLAELLDLHADPTGPAGGVVIEARMDATRGPIANVMIQEGTLKIGDVITAGAAFGRVRAMYDDMGDDITQASPSTPVSLMGLDQVPEAGDKCYVAQTLQIAQEIAEEKRFEDRVSSLTAQPKATLDTIFGQVEADRRKELNLIIRADVQGSVDVLESKLGQMGSEEVGLRILHAGVGGITEGDVVLAEASGAVIIGFGVVAEDRARRLAQEVGVEVRSYTVIYHLFEELTKALEGMLEPTYEQKILGRVQVKEVYRISRLGVVAGCLATEGAMVRDAKVRIIRENIIIREDASLESLRRFKEDVREVRRGLECGLRIAGFDDIKVDDVIEAYEMVELARNL